MGGARCRRAPRRGRTALMRGEPALQLMGARAPARARGARARAGALLPLGRWDAGRAGRCTGADRHGRGARRRAAGPHAEADPDERGGPLRRAAGRLPHRRPRRPGLPLRVLEIGASAGLNLRWDRYRYTGPGGRVGRPGLPGRDRGGVHRRTAAARCAAGGRGAPGLRPAVRSTRPRRTPASRSSPTPGRTSCGASRSCARRSTSPRRCRSRSSAAAPSSGWRTRWPRRAGRRDGRVPLGRAARIWARRASRSCGARSTRPPAAPGPTRRWPG